jgi:hypothetical protein
MGASHNGVPDPRVEAAARAIEELLSSVWSYQELAEAALAAADAVSGVG